MSMAKTVIIRTQKALDSFYTHKATLGADIGVVAGPVRYMTLSADLSHRLTAYLRTHSSVPGLLWRQVVRPLLCSAMSNQEVCMRE